MAVYYLEPSALVKYYVTEPGSAWIRTLVDAEENALVTAEISITEISAALALIARTGRISKRRCNELWGKFKRDLLMRYELLPTHRTIVDQGAELCQKHPLRGFDAIHLASGLQLRETLQDEMPELALTYVTSDDSLLTAAEAEGLVVDNPLWHTDVNAITSEGAEK